MSTSIASAPAKLILCGEHAVVYGQPAIALPLHDLRATATVAAAPAAPCPPADSSITLAIPDLSHKLISDPTHPLLELAHATLDHLRLSPHALHLQVQSAIPVASGMGSGAAVATALVRALADWAGVVLPPDEVSRLVYQSEQRFHGTPSGIDNAVIAYEQAIWYVRQQPAPLIEPLPLAVPLSLVIGDTGIRSETRLPVGAVRFGWQAEPARYKALFAAVGDTVRQIRAALTGGDVGVLGALLNQNQHLLQQMGVSSPELEHLLGAARAAGARGAKLSGGGWGGIMLALADTPDHAHQIAAALTTAGATHAMPVQVQPATAY